MDTWGHDRVDRTAAKHLRYVLVALTIQQCLLVLDWAVLISL